jgi:hypothetical protein
MGAGIGRSRPWGFNVLTRIVYVHLAFSLAVLTSALVQAWTRGSQIASLSAAAGLIIAVAVGFAMFGVAKQRSLRALFWLRLLLWMAAVRFLLGVLILAAASDSSAVESLRSILLNVVVLVPMAIYWSRPVHGRYLASWPQPQR